MSDTVGFIGIGIMGIGMVRNLVKSGRSLLVWNRDASKAEAMKAEFPDKVTVAATAADVINGCSVTYSMLSTLEASEAVFGGVLAAMGAGKSLVDCATLTPERMAEMHAAVTAKGGRFLEAPVSGSKVPAEQGALIFLCGGDKALFSEIEKNDLDAMGKASFYFGDIGAGTKMKLVVNMIMGTMLNSLAEGVKLCDAAALPCNDLIEVLGLGVMANGLIKLKGPPMVNHAYPAHFPLKHAQKDMRFALALASDLGISLPVSVAADEQFKKVLGARGDEDFAAVYEAL